MPHRFKQKKSATTPPLHGLAVVLFKPQLPENVGSVARACVNMGCDQLIVVAPKRWDQKRAEALATSKGKQLVKKIMFTDSLKDALAPFTLVFGTTARTGGWRKNISTPEQEAESILKSLANGAHVAIVFGPEDRGLTNDEIDICGQLMTIPTSGEASSLNLAQSVLVILYECLKLAVKNNFKPVGPKPTSAISHEERERLYSHMQQTLLDMDFLKKDNPDYWMLPVRRFMNKLDLQKHEYNLLMGVCRQIDWLTGKDQKKDRSDS